MKMRYLIYSALLVTVSGLLAWGYYGHKDKIRLTESLGDVIASSAETFKQNKVYFDFKSAGIVSDYERCHWTRAQINKAKSGNADELFKCEGLKYYVEPAERLKAAWRQNLAQNCEQAIKAALWDPRSYLFVDRLYIATESNGIDIRLTYSESDGFGGRAQEQKTCSYQL